MTLKKERIVNSSIDLFAENGIKNVSVTKIANESYVSRSGLYHHFKNGKKDIIAAMLQIFEECVRDSIPDLKEWESVGANAEQIFSSCSFSF